MLIWPNNSHIHIGIISDIIGGVKRGDRMIRFAPLWRTMEEQKVTTYTLRYKHGISHATVQRLQADMPVTTHTLNKLCTILNCRLEDIAEYIPDEKN